MRATLLAEPPQVQVSREEAHEIARDAYIYNLPNRADAPKLFVF
jgi:hypothetical protein